MNKTYNFLRSVSCTKTNIITHYAARASVFGVVGLYATIEVLQNKLGTHFAILRLHFHCYLSFNSKNIGL
jgi:hypothetical protein